MKIGLIQMKVVDDKGINLLHAKDLVRDAASKGADLIVLPEMFNTPYDNSYFPEYAEERGGETYVRLSKMAKDNHVYLVGGSVPRREDSKIYNTSYVFDRNGDKIYEHSKVHLFDIQIEGGQHFRESDILSPGDTFGVFPTEFGIFGLGICFDIRFATEFQKMQQEGAVLCVVPGAFNMTTGPAHWQLTFRARALDNELFMVGVSPARDLDFSYHAYGHSIVTNPWGEVVVQLGFDEEVKIVEIDLDMVDSIRRQLPILETQVK